MNVNQARVIDPLLTRRLILGPSQGDFVGGMIFPRVPVVFRGGRIIVFGSDAFAIVNTRRAPGAASKRRSVNFTSNRYQLYQDKIEGELPIELLEESQVAELPMDLQNMTIDLAKKTLELRLEYDRLNMAGNSANYSSSFTTALSGNSQWSNAASLPKQQVNTWKEQIRQTIGRYPNTAVLSAPVFNNLDTHPEIRDQFKYTSDNSLTIDMLKRYFNLENVGIATAVYINDTGTQGDIFNNSFWLGYSNPDPQPTMISPSFGYTYGLQGFPIALPAYYEENKETWYFPIKDEIEPIITYPGAGFLATNVT